MLTDTSVSDAVIARLDLDPRIPESLEIAVSADDGFVTLRGTVESFSQRRAAGQDAKNAAGVDDIDNQLKVSLTGSDRRDDDEIRGAALQNLIWDVDVPSDLVDVKVDDGWVTLKGDVSYQFQSDAAYDDVASLYGVVGVTNEIVVTNPGGGGRARVAPPLTPARCASGSCRPRVDLSRTRRSGDKLGAGAFGKRLPEFRARGDAELGEDLA